MRQSLIKLHSFLFLISCFDGRGALFLDRLRAELGEEKFWRGIAFYTSQNARRLVDSCEFEHAMEEASGHSLTTPFEKSIFH